MEKNNEVAEWLKGQAIKTERVGDSLMYSEMDVLKILESYATHKAEENKMYGCYSCDKLLRIYATKEDAEQARPRWSANCIVRVGVVKVGDGSA